MEGEAPEREVPEIPGMMHMSVPHYGVYYARVHDNDDPEGRYRLQVSVPALESDVLVWAKACVPSVPLCLPKPEDSVWVMFEMGDVRHPVWVGIDPGSRR